MHLDFSFMSSSRLSLFYLVFCTYWVAIGHARAPMWRPLILVEHQLNSTSLDQLHHLVHSDILPGIDMDGENTQIIFLHYRMTRRYMGIEEGVFKC